MFHHECLLEKIRDAENHVKELKAEFHNLIIEEYKKCESTLKEIGEKFNVTDSYVFRVTRDISRDHKKFLSHRLTDKDYRILEIIKNNPGFLRSPDIAKILGEKRQQIAYNLRKLERLECIKKDGQIITLCDNNDDNNEKKE